MARKLRIAAVCCAIALAMLLVAAWSAYRAVRQIRPFYQSALQLDQEALETGRRELESRATALYSDAQQPGPWHVTITAEQINGWLAVQLAPNHADPLPPKMHAPRVAISSQAITLGFRTVLSGVETVVSVDAAVFLTEGGAVAIRLQSMHAGDLPLPVMQVADELASACQGLSLPVRWTRHDGQPVAMIETTRDASPNGHRILIDTIELHDGSLYVAGRTERSGKNGG